MTDLEAIAKDAAERVHKNGGCVPQIAFAPILFALQDAFPAPVAETAGEAEYASGCGYTGHEFGASYPDSTCIDGYLWDLDSCEDVGGGLTHGGDIPCPKCNPEQAATPPVPAQDDDKLRIAIEALAKWEEFNAYRKSDPLTLRFEFETEEDRLAAANALDEVFASLKSTAAQEGGSK